jgi:hypothetical protein
MRVGVVKLRKFGEASELWSDVWWGVKNGLAVPQPLKNTSTKTFVARR